MSRGLDFRHHGVLRMSGKDAHFHEPLFSPMENRGFSLRHMGQTRKTRPGFRAGALGAAPAG